MFMSKEYACTHNDYDVIVIGAGNAGLTSALTLVKKGKSVALFEKHNVAGGCGTSFRRGRFEFEVALHQLSAMGDPDAPGELRLLFRDFGIEDQIEWTEIKSLYRVELPSGKSVSLPSTREACEELLIKEFPEEADAIKRYYEMVFEFAAEIRKFKSASSGGSKKEPSSLKKFIIKKAFPKMYPNLAKYAIRSAESVLDEFFKSEELKLVLNAYWCFMGVPPKDFPFAILAGCTYIYISKKPYYLKGGSQIISTAMEERLRELGGDVFLNTEVSKIIIENGSAKGVVDANGNVYHAKKIISNICPFETYSHLMDANSVSEECIDYFRNYTPGISGLVLYMGLDCPPEEVGFTDSFNLKYNSLNANKDFERSHKLDVLEDPLVATCYTVDDPSVSPPGTSVLSAGTLKYAEEWEALSPEEYHKAKYNAANDVINRLEERFPGLRSHIEELEVATPITFERYLGHPGGAIYGFQQDLKSSVFFFPQESFVENLYFAGGWVNMCGFGPNYLYGNKIACEILEEGI